MAFMLVWLRLSTNRQLDWYRNSSHQSKDIAHVQKMLAQRMADKVMHSILKAFKAQQNTIAVFSILKILTAAWRIIFLEKSISNKGD